MKHPRVASVAAIVFAIASAQSRAGAVELTEIAAKARPSVVRITLLDASGEKLGTGTGFFASTRGRIVTNHHVIEGGARATATLEDGREIAILGVLADDEKRDIAILQAEGDRHPALALGDSRALKVGEEIEVVGFPLGLSTTLSTGIVSAIRENGPEGGEREPERGRSWGIQITAAVSPGSSGSPILSRDGEVVAVAVGQITIGQNLNFGVPVEVAKGMLAALAPGAKPKPLGVAKAAGFALARNLAISAAVFGLPFLGFRVFRRRSKPKPPRAPH